MDPVQGTFEEVLVGLFDRILHLCPSHHSPTVSELYREMLYH